MANVKVAIRVRPLNSREDAGGGRLIVQVEDKVVRVRNIKLDGRLDGRTEAPGDSRERVLEFGFDYCYWSVNPEAPNYASQEEVFQDLGMSVLAGAAEGYNVCLFAYGQTGSGKTYTMMGTPDSYGLTPRICQGLFQSDLDSHDGRNCRVEVSFLEIYNERVRDLLRGADQKKPAPLRVREHPEKGPYVQGLSQHVVEDYKQAADLLEVGIANRITAATHNHDASSRSHAIFSIQYTQAILENNLPSEIVSKINLVDLAGSERADTNYCRDRITEGANINKSLVTLGIVISALAQNSQMSSSSQSINSMLSEGEVSTVGSQFSSLSNSSRKHCFIPYRDSILTWLLKDSLGGNSKTIMIATISPSCSSYNETLSTLRYAAHAKNIVNKPRVNEDANVRLIRELREEIDRLKSMLQNFSMQRNPSPSLSDERDSSISDIVLQNELKVEQLTKDWSESWWDKRSMLEQYNVDINQDRAGVQIHSLMPHLISLEPDVLSTGVTIYHLWEGVTGIRAQNGNEKDPQSESFLPEGSLCETENRNGVVTLRPLPHVVCMVNGREVTEPCRLAQGAVITLGGHHKFRFNHPAEAAVLRERRRVFVEGGQLCSSSEFKSTTTSSRVAEIGDEEPIRQIAPRQKLEEHQRYVECLRQEIQVEQRRAEKDLEREQARLQQQRTEIQQWILQEKQRLTTIRGKGMLDSGVQTDLIPLPALADLNQKPLNECDCVTVSPSLSVGDRKRVVQEELLKHHALRRNENHVRRKRLHYQLQRIARKRHLLEAKQELRRMENNLSVGADESSSPEFRSPSKRRGRPVALRRHSFSADLLSRIYPQHTPIFSQFLRRNRSTEFTSSFCTITTPRKWVSDEDLPERTRARSNTMPSIGGQRSSMYSSENIRMLPTEDTTVELTDRKVLKSQLESSVWNNHDEDQNISQKSTVDSSRDTKHVLPIIKQMRTQKCSTKGGKGLTLEGSKGLETIRKALSRSVGSGIRTALSRVFRKPPLGSRSGKGAKSAGKAKAQFVAKENKDKTVGAMEKRDRLSIRPSVSCDGLDELKSLKDKKQGCWHSAETLNSKNSRWVMVQQEQPDWVENNGEEDTDGSSDCDSLFSVDSLSSAYANALAEQLQQEDHEPSEAENSQMSKDSLAKERSGISITAKPALKLSHSVCHSFSPKSNLQTTMHGVKSKDMPAEILWSIHVNKVAKGSSQTLQVSAEIRPSSDASVRETDHLLTLTDAWSSNDAAESPQNPKATESLLKQELYTPAENCSSQSLSSLDLSGEVYESERQTLPYFESTESGGATVKEQSHKSSERETNLDYFSSNPTSTSCSTPEYTTPQENNGLLSNSEPQYTSGESSSSQDMTNNHTLSTNKPIPLKSMPLERTDDDLQLINSHSNRSNVMQDGSSSECLPGISHDKDLQNRFTDQAAFIATGVETDMIAIQKGSTESKEATMSKENLPFLLGCGPSKDVITVSKCGHNTPPESQQSDKTMRPESVLKSSNIQQPHRSAMCSLKMENLLHESQRNTELFIQVASDGKTLVQNQEVSHYTDSHETRNGKDHLLKMNSKLESASEVADCVPLEYESCNAQYEHSRKRSKDSQDISNCNTKIPKIACTQSFAPCDPAVANMVFKFNATSGSSRVATEKALTTETESENLYSGYKKRMFEQESKLVSVDNSIYRPELTGTKQQKTAKHLMNGTEVVDGRESVGSKPQKICQVINEQISEVVKVHLNMVVSSKDFNRNQETENKKSSALNAEDLKNIQHKYEVTSANIEHLTQSHPDTLPCRTISGTSVDNVTNEKCFFERSSTEKLGALGTDFITNCLPRPLHNVSVVIWDSDDHNAYGPVPNTASGQDLNIDSKEASTVLCVGSADNDSLKAEHFNVLISEVNMERKIPGQLTSVSTYLQCAEIISNPEFTTSADNSKSDRFATTQSEMVPINNACHDPTSTETSVRIKERGFEHPSCIQGQPGPRPETTSISGKTKENSDVQVSIQRSEAAVDCITSDMHKEAAMCKSVEESKVNMTEEFQQGINTVVHTDAESEIQRNECLFNSIISFSGAESCLASDSGLQKLAHPECSLGYPAEEQFFSQDHSELNANDRNDKSVERGNHTFHLNRNKTTTVSKSWQHRAESSTPSELQRDNQLHNTQTVITCRKTYSCPRPDQSSCKEINNDCRSKIQAQCGTVQKENQLQFQESSMLTESLKTPDHDTRWAVGHEAKNADTSTKTESLKVKPKDHHEVKIETAAKANGVEEQTRMSFSKPNDDTVRLKPKRYRRAHFTAPSSSSTDSTPDSSLDKIAKSKVHKYTVATSVKNCSPTIERPNVVSENINIADDLSTSPSSAINPKQVESRLKDHQSLGSGTGTFLSYTGATRDVTTVVVEDARCHQQRQNHPTSELLQIPAGMSVDDEVHLAMDNSSKHTSLKVHKESDSTQNREPVIHFTSSDINPFAHARKSDHLLKPLHNNQSFGSAVAISRQLSPLEYSDKVITRCCSVDNGLNVQNSPFDSHLSMFAIQKGLSSTLSSTEDSKERILEAPQFNKVFDIPFVFKEKSSVSSSRGSNSATLESGHSSGQVDEIVLVCSSEHGSQKNRQDSSSFDHSTQTVMFEDLKLKSRHRRSTTQVPVSRQAHGKPTTWSSLQNMSEHLSELIVSTSDLLGNIQSMRTGERPRRVGHPIQKNLKVCPDKFGKSDGSTQTAINIGIQTEDSPLFMKQNEVLHNSPPIDNAKPQEVSVIVKVIGPEICNTTKEVGVFRNQYDNRQSFDNMKSMPDLHPRGPSPSKQFGTKLEGLKFHSLDTVVPNQNCFTTRVVTPDTVDYIASNPSSNQRCKRTSEKLANENEGRQTLKPKSSLDKRVNGLLVDRASSPILTVEVPRCSQKGITKSAQQLSNHNSSKVDAETQLSRTIRNPHKNTTINSHSHRVCGNKPGYSMSLENLSFKSFTNTYGSDTSSTEISISNRCTQNEIKKSVCEVQNKGASQAVLCNTPSQSLSSPLKPWRLENHPATSQSCGISMPECKPSNDLMTCWSDTSKNSPQYQDMDMRSLAPSECNTDILISINPLNESTPLKKDHWIPHDLPMHNKFTNWSGINQEPMARLINEKTAIAEKSLDINANSLQRHSDIVGYKHQSDLEGTDRRTREIERLRKEREQVLSSIHLDPSPHPLSVELTEARLHYGLGETDTLLKMLKSSNRGESTISTKQQLNDRHRRSIDGLRKAREACLQPPRRARSLSPSRHTNSSNHKMEHPQRALDLPSRQREYLQQLRKEVVEMTRVPDPPRREGQCPTDIELLLRDYSRAREEAKMEIAKARVRLRERTEQEKRRLQQQALTQAVKDDLRHRTRVSNSTLCTGSNLSLSSGPTSGYNSSNAALLKDATSPSVQITGVSDVGLRVQTRPPMIPSQSLKTSRVWLSVQDIRLESSSNGELQSSSSPSSPPARQRTCSFGSPSAISISYQDIADCTITSAISEVHLASGGDIRNLLTGKAKAGWRHQGLERGVQTYHRPSPRPSAHGFLGAMELERSLTSLRSVIRDHSKLHLYHQSLKSAWTRSLDESTQLVYLLTDPSNCQLKQPRDFCCLSTESRQDDMWVLAMQSVFEECLPRPSVDTVRGEMFPSAWILQPSQRQGRDVVLVVYLLQVDLGTPSLPQRLLYGVARNQAAAVADLNSFLSL